MPKKILENLVLAIEREIRGSFPVGARYKSVRQTAASFNVSLQTAHRALKLLCRSGMVSAQRKSGIFVRAHDPQDDVRGRRVILLSNNCDDRFNEGFFDGVSAALEPQGIDVRLMVNEARPTNNLDFGEYLLHLHESHGASGMIAIYFQDTALPFYHLLTKGVNLISDVALESLPVLPVVATDHERHARQAARIMKEWNKSRVLVAAFWYREDHTRLVAFKDEFCSNNPGVQVQYLNLGLEQSHAMLHNFFRPYASNKAVFSAEFAATHIIGSCFHQYDIDVKKNLVIYDSERDAFEFRGLKPVKGVAPSFGQLGRRLAEKMLHKIRSGQWQEPLLERI